MNLPPISHSTHAIPGTKLFNHESHFVQSVSQVNDVRDSSTLSRERLLYSRVYGPIIDSLAATIPQLSSDPTLARQNLTSLHNELNNLIR